jgi:acyl carrier protein
VTDTTTALEQLAEGVRAILGLEEVDLDMPLSQVGIDSLNVVELILVCQQVYTNVVNFDEIEIDENTTLREIDAQLSTLSS